MRRHGPAVRKTEPCKYQRLTVSGQDTGLADCWKLAAAVLWRHEFGLPGDDLSVPFCPDHVRAEEVARNWTADRKGSQRIQAGFQRIQGADRVRNLAAGYRE